MREVIIKSKIVGREGAIGGGKPIAFPDLSAYALRSDFIRLESSFNEFLEGDDTDNVINRWKELEAFLNNISEDYNLLSLLNGKADKATTLSGYGITDAYTKTNVDDLLKAYVTLGGTQTITGEKNFTGGLKVNGSPIYYDTEKKYWKLEGDLLVTGGVTMYGNEGTYTPSTIMDAIAVDGTTISKSGGVLKVIGGTGGGVADSVAWANITGKPNFASVATSGKYEELIGKPTLLSSFTDDVVSGKYLPLSGGTLANTSAVPLTINANNDSQTALFLQSKGNNKTYVGWDTSRGSCLYEFASDSHIGILNGVPRFNSNTLWHSGNDGSGSGLDADLLDGQHNGNLTAQYFSVGKILTSSDTINKLMSGVYCYINGNNPVGSIGYNAILLSFRNNGRTDMFQLANSANEHTLYYRSASNIGNSYENWSSWKTIAFTDSNVASATYSPNTSKLYSTDNIYSYGSANPYYGYLTYNQTYNEWDFKVSPNNPEYIHVYSSDKLRTARTIWGQSFDGTGNVSGDIGNTSAIAFDTSRGAVDIGYLWTNTLGMHMDMSGLGTEWQGTNLTITPFGNVGIGTPTPKGKLDIKGSTWIGAGDYVANRATLLLNSNKGNAADIIFKNGSTTTGNYGTWAISVRHESDYRFSIWRGVENGDIASESEVLKLHANGNLLVTGGITMYSDQRKKTILNHVELSLKDIADAPLIEHYYNGDEKRTTHVGSIAQYWASMNDWFCKLDSEGYYTMEIQNAALASAISIARELDRYETKTDKAIKKLKKRICELEEEIERLKSV